MIAQERQFLNRAGLFISSSPLHSVNRKASYFIKYLLEERVRRIMRQLKTRKEVVSFLNDIAMLCVFD